MDRMDTMGRVRRHPASHEDKPYVVRLALAGGALQFGEDPDTWWAGVYPYVWILRVREVRVGYVVVRPVYDVSIATVSGARDDGVAAAALRGIRQGVLTGWAPSRHSPEAQLFEAAGFHRNRDAGVYYVRDPRF